MQHGFCATTDRYLLWEKSLEHPDLDIFGIIRFGSGKTSAGAGRTVSELRVTSG